MSSKRQSSRNQKRAFWPLFMCVPTCIVLATCFSCSAQIKPSIAENNPQQETPAPKKAPTNSSAVAPDITDKKPLSASQAEYERRMKSLEGAIEKENRPELPKFEGAAKKRNGSITFDDIKFEMEKGEKFNREMLTDEIIGLVKQTISIKGYIRPNNKNKGLKKFVFVRDDKECCFGPGAALYDCILVKLAEGKETDFTVRPITIEGEFFLKEFNGPDRRVWAVYRMKNGRVVK